MNDVNEPVLHGRVAIVTGGGRGVGEALALALADAGADIALAGRTEARLEAVAKEVASRGRRVHVALTDITDAAAVGRLVESTVQELGRLDILVNNAGTAHGGDLATTTDEEWDTVVHTNLRGTFLAMRAAGRHMLGQGSGKVINIASNFAFKGVPQFASYCASKAGIVALTKVAAVEWARYGIQVNALAPGYFITGMNEAARADAQLHERILRQIPARRMGEPSELGRWAVLLASPASDFVSGETIVIDGGQLAR